MSREKYKLTFDVVICYSKNNSAVLKVDGPRRASVKKPMLLDRLFYFFLFSIRIVHGQ